MSVPQTTIYVCKGVPLNSRYEHTIHFGSPEEQQEYFAGRVDHTFPAYSFVRRHAKLKVQATEEEARAWNYLYFKNRTYSTQYYYYFINRINYVNDNTVELELEMDVMQTYHFEYTIPPCFIERQHASNDSFGANTVDEGLGTGDYVDINEIKLTELLDLSIMIASTVSLQPGFPNILGTGYNGVFSGLKVHRCHNFNDMRKLLDRMNDDGKTEGIVNMWMYPTALAEDGTQWAENSASGDSLELEVYDIYKDKSYNTAIGRPTKLDGYEPKNNKLFTAPYNVIYATNNNGQSATYAYELFEPGYSNGIEQYNFTVCGSMLPDGGMKLIPRNYKNNGNNYDEGLTLTALPTCPWNSDEYKIWLAQTQHSRGTAGDMAEMNMAFGLLGGIGATVAGAVSVASGNVLTGAGAMIGGVASGVNSAKNAYQTIKTLSAEAMDKSIQPAQARGSFSPSIAVANNMHTFSLHRRCIRAERAKQIDDYFHMYGYKVNAIGEVNPHARTNFTYVKTAGCHINATFNNEDAVKIESIYDNGITFWRPGSPVGDYSVNNSTL